MKLNTINSQDSAECLRAIAELSQVRESDPEDLWALRLTQARG